MESLNLSLIPMPFPLANTGCVCYLNAFMQALTGCTSLLKTVGSPLSTSATKKAFDDFLAGKRETAPILAALKRDRSGRKPFGVGQECVGEALVHIIESLDQGNPSEPLAQLFLHRYRWEYDCPHCRKTTARGVDENIVLNMFFIPQATWPQSSETFAMAIKQHVSPTADYICEACHKIGGSRRLVLTLVSEILVCAFNQFGKKEKKFFPLHFQLEGRNKNKLTYQLVAQIEHSGSQSGGHYWARCLRKDGKVYLLNDTSVSESMFEHTPQTAFVVYHVA